jgi:hypothetical protein
LGGPRLFFSTPHVPSIRVSAAGLTTAYSYSHKHIVTCALIAFSTFKKKTLEDPLDYRRTQVVMTPRESATATPPCEVNPSANNGNPSPGVPSARGVSLSAAVWASSEWTARSPATAVAGIAHKSNRPSNDTEPRV